MNRRPWIPRHRTVGILLMILMTLNPELRAFLWVINIIGLDLLIFCIAIQLRFMLPAIPSIPYSVRALLCVVSYATLRIATRGIALLLTPVGRATAGLNTLLWVVSKNMGCPTLKPNFRPN